MKIVIEFDEVIHRDCFGDDLCTRIWNLIGNFFGWSADERKERIKITWSR